MSNMLPYHLRRYMANLPKVPHTHFCMLQEMTIKLIAPLEVLDYTLPDNLIPDISEGLMFSRWLRENKDIEPRNFPTYQHSYEDGRRVPARLYPNDLLPDFQVHFHEVWLLQRSESYFAERDPDALPALRQHLVGIRQHQQELEPADA